MRRWLYLAAVVVSAAASATLLVLQFVSFAPSVAVQRLSAFAHLFGSALPLPLAQFVPDALTVGLAGVTFVVSTWRLLRMATARALVTPESLATWPFRLLAFALVSFALCVGLIAIAHLAGRSELIPIGFILGWPAAMLLAPVVTYVELREAWRRRRRSTP